MGKLKIIALLVLIGASNFLLKAQDSISIFPNPTTGPVTIEISLSHTDTVTINIYNRWGQVAIHPITDTILQIGIHPILIDLSTKANEVYFGLVAFRHSDRRIFQILKQATLFIHAETNLTQNQIQIFPNPVGQFMKIAIPENMISKPCNLTLFNLQGNKIKIVQMDQCDNELVVELENIPNGMYFLRIENEQGFYQSKFIIQY